MRVAELGLDPRLVERLHELGYDELWPSQVEAAKHAVAGRNLVLAVPTASGKSLVAYLAVLQHALKGGKALFLVPLRALAAEKYEDLKQFESLGVRVALSVGDLDSADPYLRDFDIIVCTSEKADALMRHRAHWLSRMSAVVADEVHLINDPGRGPTLEVTLSRFRQLNPDAQVIALSATVHNSQEVARWLDAEHVKSEWRPVTLREGVLFGRAIHYTDNGRERVESEFASVDPVLGLVDDAVAGGGQALVFVNTRKSTEALAHKLRDVTRRHLTGEERAALTDDANRLRGGPDATDVESKLAESIAAGAAFHHAGLTNKERRLVEEAFKAGRLKALAATPTLAAGINLPARRVIVRDLWRFDSDVGRAPLPVMEYKQMAGRAGRPKYDSEGQAITVAKNQNAKDEILLNYLLAESETVHSKLGSEPALRSHVLASIATGYVDDEASLREFIKSTFFAEQGEMWTIETQITQVLDFLLENDLITATGDQFEATKYGRRVSELYIDPLSAVKLRRALEEAGRREGDPTDFALLHAVCACPDMRTLYLRRSDGWLEAEAAEREEEVLTRIPRGAEYEWFLAELKTATLLRDWMEEAPQERITTKYNAYPGDVHNKVDAAEWLLYAMGEVAKLYHPEVKRQVARLATRVRHGAKEELLPLLKFRGVGRYRARQLWNAGYKGAADLRKASAEALAQVPGIGPTVAANIKRELGQEVAADVAEAAADEEGPVAGQLSLAHFRGDKG